MAKPVQDKLKKTSILLWEERLSGEGERGKIWIYEASSITLLSSYIHTLLRRFGRCSRLFDVGWPKMHTAGYEDVRRVVATGSPIFAGLRDAPRGHADRR